MPSALPVGLFLLLLLFLAADAHGGHRAGLEALDRDLLFADLADPEGPVLDARHGVIDLLEQDLLEALQVLLIHPGAPAPLSCFRAAGHLSRPCRRESSRPKKEAEVYGHDRVESSHAWPIPSSTASSSGPCSRWRRRRRWTGCCWSPTFLSPPSTCAGGR